MSGHARGAAAVGGVVLSQPPSIGVQAPVLVVVVVVFVVFPHFVSFSVTSMFPLLG